MRTVKKYKAFFVDKAGNNIDYTTFVFAKDSGEAMDRANNIMQEMQDDNLSHAIVTLVINQGSNWAGIYR
jgi:hypothetical protein